MNKSYFSVNNWLVDIPSGSILHLITGERKRLGEYQLKLLDVFIHNAGIILTREELTQLVWERRVIGSNSLPNAIHALRSALEDDGKQQKIIKTIPKKGYLLESEYCCSVIKEELEVSDAAIEQSLAAPAEQPAVLATRPGEAEPLPVTAVLLPERLENQALSDNAEQPAVRPQGHRRFFILFISFIILALLGCASTWYFLQRQTRMVAEEQETSAYSNIHIYQLAPANLPSRNQEKLYDKLKDTLYQLNQMLKAQSISMNVYYSSANTVLNYTFSLSNKCDSKQLAMEIYHWRIDRMQLNNLILRETKRKLNEMAVCPHG